MSPRLFLLITLVAFVLSAGASVLAWNIVQTQPGPGAEPETNEMNSPSGEEQRRRREKFFGGSSDHNIRSGQEMKPRW